MHAGIRNIAKMTASFSVVVLAWQTLSHSHQGSYFLLALAYTAFFLPFAFGALQKSRIVLTWFAMGCWLACFGWVALLLSEKAQLRPLYPLATTLAYLLLFVLILVTVQAWIFSKPHSMQLHFQKRYLIYSLVLAGLFWATTTMDRRDPYGPHFQLKVMVLVLFALLVMNWFSGQWRLVKSLESAHLQAELDHLKSQIHPHFLFNTLNNLYGLAREKSDLTEMVILKLSELLRYGLYQAQKERVPLALEIDYLRNYLDLQQLRHPQSLELELDFQPGPGTFEIAPLLLIPLVENAFKHGAELMANNAQIQVHLRVAEAVLKFRVTNRYPEGRTAATGGLGLANLTKRLQLLYPERHQFHLTRSDGLAVAELSIVL